MSYLQNLPAEVSRLIRTQMVAEYATVSAAGAPLDTPTFVFTSPDLETLDVATGLAYPLKAERARKNPKVGLMIAGGADQPVVSIAGYAAVRDADLQANLERYLAETILTPVVDPKTVDWSVTREAIWYLARIFVSVKPSRIRWWASPAEMDAAPQEWRAPDGAAYPASDPDPVGEPSPGASWPQPPWPELAQGALARGAHAHLALMDEDGFPLPLPVRDLVLDPQGFQLTIPGGAPWSQGKASLSFEGREMFVGEAQTDGGRTLLRIARALPVFPLAADFSEILQPTLQTRAALMARLTREAERRGQSLPMVPETPPGPTAGARARAAG